MYSGGFNGNCECENFGKIEWLPSARKNDRVASASLRRALIGKMSFVGPRPDVPGYADKLVGKDRDVLKLRPGITGPATLKYRLEDEMISEYVAAR